MSVADWVVQTAIYDKLTADATLTGIVSGIFDQVPEDVPYPYVAIGDATEVPEDAHDRQGLAVTVTLHIWSRYRGYAEAAAILKEVDRILDRKPLTVDGFHTVTVAHEFHQSLRDPDPQIRHIPVRYRIRLEEETV